MLFKATKTFLQVITGNSISSKQILTPYLMRLICFPVGWRYLSRMISFQRISALSEMADKHLITPSSLFLFPDLFPKRGGPVAEQQTTLKSTQHSTAFT